MVAMAVTFLWLAPKAVFATPSTDQDPPTANVYEAHGFANVMEPDDRLILIRYDLPLAEWAFDGKTATTTNPVHNASDVSVSYMKNATCTEISSLSSTNPLPDSCYTSLLSGIVTHQFFNGVASDPDSQNLGIRTLPRIGDGMSGLYIRAGHGLAPLSGGTDAEQAELQTYETCLTGAVNVFTAPTFTGNINICLKPIWHPTALVTDKSSLTQTMVAMVLNIQEEMEEPVNRFVAQDVITEEGIVFPREAFTLAVQASPDAFYTGVSQPWLDYDTDAVPSALEKQLETGAQATTMYKAVVDTGSWYFGMEPNVSGTLGAFALIGIVVTATAVMTRGVTYPAVLGLLVLLGATFMGFVPVAGVWVAMAGFLTLGATVIFRKFPQ
jgi:hypothetical protein